MKLRSGRIKVVLTADGHAVDVVRDGLEALRWARTYPYEMVILDVVLPGLDGLAVCVACGIRASRRRS